MTTDISRFIDVLRNDGIALLPTDTIYGLHALANSEHAIKKLIEIKSRDDDKPFVVLAASIEQIDALNAKIDRDTRGVLSQLWPGPLTAIVAIEKPLAATRGSSTVAVRVPALPWLRDLLERTGPLASTSVNESGEPPLISLDQLSIDLRSRIDALYDVGPLEGKPSAIVDFTGDEPRLIREGESFFTQKVWKTLRKSL